MSITVHMPNEKLAKAFLAAKPDKVAKTNRKKIGVVGITRAENAQLGLLLKYIFTNDEVYNSLPADVLRYPEALNKLAGRYS